MKKEKIKKKKLRDTTISMLPIEFPTTKKVVPIDHVIPNRWNPNVQSDFMIEKGKKAVQEFGFLGAILVRETAGVYEIIDGEHRWRYLKELGSKEIPVESLGEISETNAKTLTILMNRLRGEDDIEKRSAILNELNKGQLALLPFTEEEIENEKKLFHFDFSQFDNQEEVKEKSTDALIQIQVPKDVAELWKKAIVLGSKQKKPMNEVQVLIFGLEYFFNMHEGAAPNQRDINLK